MPLARATRYKYLHTRRLAIDLDYMRRVPQTPGIQRNSRTGGRLSSVTIQLKNIVEEPKVRTMTSRYTEALPAFIPLLHIYTD